MTKYLRTYETIPDNVTGILLMKGKKYKVIKETDDAYYIDFDEKSQENLHKDVKFSNFGFEKVLEGKIYDIIEEIDV